MSGMNSIPAAHSPGSEKCAFVWCTTEHGHTVHPDDEVHRSAGTGFPARVREGFVGGGTVTDIEVGLVRGPDDRETWVALEFGAGRTVAIDAAAARVLGRLLREDRDIAAALRNDAG
ncbi:hypothetical protein [Microbacterium sp. Kw_RZR3]|uniref:DUF6907 domain-containing protein n=1 Tax=unclassified Microbacterium TaxID=2609290 RepID=UPI0023D9EB99|nr:hypothetical protein [Microbacterium sp. Kw_RZR3]MDF2045879.1 hypothetical protein [Microbacterium sp. Kw_RZR3]